MSGELVEAKFQIPVKEVAERYRHHGWLQNELLPYSIDKATTAAEKAYHQILHSEARYIRMLLDKPNPPLSVLALSLTQQLGAQGVLLEGAVRMNLEDHPFYERNGLGEYAKRYVLAIAITGEISYAHTKINQDEMAGKFYPGFYSPHKVEEFRYSAAFNQTSLDLLMAQDATSSSATPSL